MKKNEFLQDAIGLIDQELVLAAGDSDGKRRPALWVRWVAAAASLALLLGGVLHLLPEKEEGPLPGWSSGNIMIAENLWQREDFSAFSLSYRFDDPLKMRRQTGGGVVLLSDTTTSPTSDQTDLETTTISISQNQTFKFERLIAQRYAVYRSETGFVMFYDTVEDRQIDLQERILGDTGYMLAALKEGAYLEADIRYPGFLDSPVNRQLLDLYLSYAANDTLSEHWDEIVAIIPDTDFLDAMGYQYRSEEDKRTMCRELCWDLFVYGLGHMDEEMYQSPYVVSILGIDEINGICIIVAKTIAGSGAEFLVYDVRTDTFRNLPNDGGNLYGMMQVDGYMFRFSADGTVATVVYPDAHLEGGNLHGDLTQRFVIDTKDRLVRGYRGEKMGVCFLEYGIAREIEYGRASSELFISPNNSVLYYKQMEKDCSGRTFHASDIVWYNRLKLYNCDTDSWVFHTFDINHNAQKGITLQGNFVRFAANETIVIMERGGKYYAHSLLDGKEVTQDIKDGKVSMYAHEQLVTLCKDGVLLVTNMFTGQQQTLGQADMCVLSSDGAFAFVYCDGDSYVTCYNVASGENCRIGIDHEMREQLFAREDAVLQMSYNEQENTLLLSYYAEKDVSGRYDTNVDFYDLLAQLQDENPDSRYPDHPKVITDLTVTEEVVNRFRSIIDRWPGGYPEGITRYENKTSIFECLGLTEPEDYLDVNGTQFILYEDEDEKLVLIFWQHWLLYDYQDYQAGFSIEYTVNGRVYNYSFYAK